MALTKVEIRTVASGSLAVGSSGPRTVTIDRTKEAGGQGLGFNGGELLLLAIGGCYSNDIFREASKRGINVRSVQVTVSADWGWRTGTRTGCEVFGQGRGGGARKGDSRIDSSY